ncbi:hypothetical protein AB4424_25440, partial [Vibrio splendidus]
MLLSWFSDDYQDHNRLIPSNRITREIQPCIVVMTKQEDYMKKALLLIALLASPTLASQLTEVFT